MVIDLKEKHMIKIIKVETFVFRYPLRSPVKTSFGIMNNRPMVLVRVEDEHSNFGWGEIWCNFPDVGAEHRARLTESVIAPLMLSKVFINSEDVFSDLTQKTWILALQTGEYGPISQCIAGIDIAIHDMVAKINNVPIWKMLGGKNNKVNAYASGINPHQAIEMGKRALDLGFQNLKLKIGFGKRLDLINLENLFNLVEGEGKIMADANQAWSIEIALGYLTELDRFNLNWLEEPLPVDRPENEWRILKERSSIPLAGGENIASEKNFEETIDKKILSVVQPDLAKWGGFTKCIPLAKKIVENGLLFCPHYLGGGIGLVASAHALAAVGGDGMLEIDLNDNPLRTETIEGLLDDCDGQAKLSTLPGLGIEVNLNKIEKFRVLH
jgi:L-alanine-DL-glutamate epimerase-like enolase superfamily enzyme